MKPFTWWRVNEYGCAYPVTDSPEVSAQIDADPQGWFGNVEGTILHAGVQATAFKRRRVRTYDAALWLETGAMVPAGEIMETRITAEPPKAIRDGELHGYALRGVRTTWGL